MQLFKTIVAAAILALFPIVCHGQGDITRLDVQTRFDWQGQWEESSLLKSATGFKGKYFNVRLDGVQGEHLSYSIRQRLNRAHTDASYFTATDWAWVDWKFSEKFSVNAGKQVVSIGGFEYDRAPIDLYQCSEFWNNVACYQLGVSASYVLGGNDKLSFQFCQSPNSPEANTYSYNLIWYGGHGLWSSIWSTNLVESHDGRYMNYIALGNRFDFGQAALELDLMNRSDLGDFTLGDDLSVMAELQYCPSKNLTVFGKYTYDANDSNVLDRCVFKGTNISRAGAGLVLYPMKDSRMLRFHAQAAYASGKNANSYGTITDGQLMVDFGLTFNLDALAALRRSR